ncbi:hypothetical protein [Azorhizobium caulinodans]|uniref:hypothetical protein n=1 Tax=Azorhizobium caulinodans TaxID=7 RepID=UPI002FBDC4B2
MRLRVVPKDLMLGFKSLAYLFILAWLTAPVVGQTIQADRVVREVVGCKDWDAYKQLVRIAVSGDKEAFAKLATLQLMNGTCMMLKAGDAVYLQEVSMLSGAMCVRPRGEVACFWIPIDAAR